MIPLARAGARAARFVLLGSLLLSGCSTFNRDWQALAGQPAAPGDLHLLQGRWEGTWLSNANGHTGGMRCIVTAQADNVYLARYRATYGCCFSFEYTVPMNVEISGDIARFQGSADLGWLAGGVYHYEGQAAGEDFHSTYRSAKDVGTFALKRVH